jgi:hypothetical protein
MRTRGLFVLAALLCVTLGARGSIISVTGAGDGNVNCTGITLLNDSATVNATQCGSGQVVTNVTTNSIADPHLTVINAIDNDTDFTWTDYQVQVSMAVPFTLSGAANDIPGDWTATVTQAPTFDGVSLYVGQLDYAVGTGTPVAIGDTLETRFVIGLSGSTTYQYTESMTPTPEPATLSLIAMGGLAMLRRRR